MENLPPSEHLCRDISEQIWDSLNLGLILIDAAGVVLLWNKWIARHSGIPAHFAVSRPLDTLFPDGLSAPFKTAIKNALAHKLPIVLSNALHRSPLPLYPAPVTSLKQERIQQSIAISQISSRQGQALCLIQITDASVSLKRERVLKTHSERLSFEAVTDALTGMHNRRFFDERFIAEFGRAQRLAIPLSLIMLDVDCFKPYNDKYGHPAGDRVLSTLAATLKAQLNRPTDVLARYGGEEFVIILPDSGEEGSGIVAEKLRAAIADLNIPHGASTAANHVTISIGIATCTSHSHCNAACLLDTADQALYRAKHDGRNCVRHLVSPRCGRHCPELQLAAQS